MREIQDSGRKRHALTAEYYSDNLDLYKILITRSAYEKRRNVKIWNSDNGVIISLLTKNLAYGEIEG